MDYTRQKLAKTGSPKDREMAVRIIREISNMNTEAIRYIEQTENSPIKE